MRCLVVVLVTLHFASASREACDDQDEGSLLQVKDSMKSEDLPCGVVQNKVKIDGNKIHDHPESMAFDSAACREKCGNTAHCKAWTFNKALDQCFLFNQLNHFSCPTDAPHYQSGFCDPPEAPEWCSATTTTTTTTTTKAGDLGDECGSCGSTGMYYGECQDGLVCTPPQNTLLGGCPTCQKPPGNEVGEKCGTSASDGYYYGECQAGLLCAPPADAAPGAYNVCANICGTFGGSPPGDHMTGGCNRAQSCSCKTDMPCSPWITVEEPSPEGCFMYCC